MKTTLFFIAIFLTFVTTNAQFGSQQIISSETDKAYFSIPIDIDNDGFMDLLSAQAENHRLVWFRNLDGLGNFGSKTVIVTGSSYSSVAYVDIDTDGDNDIVLIGNGPGDVSWIENLDGQGNFATEEVALITNPDMITNLKTLDFDMDGDLDIIANIDVDFNDNKIVWFENLDGSGNFGPENVLATHNEFFYPPLLVDIDNDGDLDVLTSKEGITSSRIVWYENLGNTQLGVEQVIYEHVAFTNTSNILYADVNTDGKKDIIITYFTEDNGTRHGWLENLNDNGSFAKPTNFLNVNPDTNILTYDFDNDQDIDLLLLNRNANRISWMRNDEGLGVFGFERTITTEIDFPRDARAADIDGDGILDVVSASLGDDKVAWYKNTGILGIAENNFNNIKLFPNPTGDKVYFNTSEIIETATVYDVLGTKIKIVHKPVMLGLRELSTGIYFIKVSTEAGQTSVEKIIKK